MIKLNTNKTNFNYKKSKLGLALSAAIALSNSAIAAPTQPIDEYDLDNIKNCLNSIDKTQTVPKLRVAGNQIITGQQQGGSIAGPSLFWSSDGWGGERFYNADTVKRVKNELGASVIRATMGAELSGKGGYLETPLANLNKVSSVIDAAIDNGMYVIIDWNSHDANKSPEKAIEFFTEMAKRYGHKNNVIYEIFGDPIDQSWPTIKNYAEQVISEIRAIDPDNLIIVGTGYFGQEVNEPADDPITLAKNIAYSLHFFAGTHSEDLRQRAQSALDKGIALFASEWGMVDANGDGGIAYDNTDEWMDFLKKNNIPHTIWALNDRAEGSAIFKCNEMNHFQDCIDPIDDKWQMLTETGEKAKEIIQNWPHPQAYKTWQEASTKELTYCPLHLKSQDSDSDGIVDAEDNCPDTANPNQWDNDNDNIGNKCDSDVDGDGYSNDWERAYGYKVWQADSPTVNLNDNMDSDQDGITDHKDNCIDTANPGQWDKDKDGIGNACDKDIDGDGFDNDWEITNGFKPWDKNSPGQEFLGQDQDNDKIDDGLDNCPTIANSGQWDRDKDGIGNECDLDIDGDGFTNDEEIVAKTKVWDRNSYPFLQDNDGDTIRNSLDNCPNIANKSQNDLDQDGIGNECDLDIDGDGWTNTAEIAGGFDPYDPLSPKNSDLPNNKQANPFANSNLYFNPLYANAVGDAIENTDDPALKAAMAKMQLYPSAIWYNSIESLTQPEGNALSYGLRGDLNSAYSQRNNDGNSVISIVLNALPKEYCNINPDSHIMSAEFSSEDFERYKKDYIDEIVAAVSMPIFKGVKVAAIIEPGLIGNIVLNEDRPMCHDSRDSYQKVLSYALAEFAKLDNVYSYIDVGNAAQLGWDTNRIPLISYYKNLVEKIDDGNMSIVDGFVSNVANYVPTEEPYLNHASTEGFELRTSQFYDWNSFIDEKTYAETFHQELVAAGFDANSAMLIDTSRNGWGKHVLNQNSHTDLPFASVDNYVDAKRIDGRTHRNSWCNIAGAGLGEKPQFEPYGTDSPIKAFLWLKTPGLSDGTQDHNALSSSSSSLDPMCDPEYSDQRLTGGKLTGAMDKAPAKGEWHQAQFEMLIKNATPKLGLMDQPKQAEAHVANPFEGAQLYIDPQYSANVEQSITQIEDQDLKQKMQVVKSTSTAIWLDSIEAVHGGENNAMKLGLEQHLETALIQSEAYKPTVVQIVLHNLPDRDCGALYSNGTLQGGSGIEKYKAEYIDVITNIITQVRFSQLRIVVIIEPHALPNIITNSDLPHCQYVERKGYYQKGIQYALNAFAQINNTYSYLSIANSSWLGWKSNMQPAINLYTDIVKGASNGDMTIIDGFVSNVARYAPNIEPHIPSSRFTLNNTSDTSAGVRSASFFDWNDHIAEKSYIEALYDAFVAQGFPADLAMLIDTSRNGWGGTTSPRNLESPSNFEGSTEDFVNTYRIDRRSHRGNWCNQTGAGIGKRPQNKPFGENSPIEAFIWVKPPGESDGHTESKITSVGPEGRSYDPMCEPSYSDQRLNGGKLTQALNNAPEYGQWHHEQFKMLVENAYPEI